jgi:streptomycin 6-kinase
MQDLYGEVGKLWLHNLPQTLLRLEKKWDIVFINPMPGLTYHFVAKVNMLATGETAILKMGPPSAQNIAKEAAWLAAFEQAVPTVYWYDEANNAFLMENLQPGLSLKAMVKKDDEAATRIICRTLLDLQTHQTKEISCKHLSALAISYDSLQGKIDPKLLSQAKAWFKELSHPNSSDRLLHGDLHHDNILSSSESWKVIDPHGYLGDPTFEVGPMIYNPGGADFPTDKSLAQVIERRLKVLVEELPFDAKRIKAWTFCMTLLSIAWTVEDHLYVPPFELEVAKLINKINL